ncbi:MAG: hypothetical protein KGM91_23600 [Burkholderiales bacterium]|nr:hypothetical protein [Burkholderiales bacterium]
MFGHSKVVSLGSYRDRRSRRRPPRWLVLIVLGIVLGAGGVILIQQRYLPRRLSVDESAQLQNQFNQANSEQLRFKQELDTASAQLAKALSENKRLNNELGTSRNSVDSLQQDLSAAVEMLPPDPRAGVVAIRGARFSARAGGLDYAAVITTGRSAASLAQGLARLVVVGQSGSGAQTSIATDPVAVRKSAYQVVRGRVPLPAGFKPSQATVQVLDGPGGKALGWRTIRID